MTVSTKCTRWEWTLKTNQCLFHFIMVLAFQFLSFDGLFLIIIWTSEEKNVLHAPQVLCANDACTIFESVQHQIKYFLPLSITLCVCEWVCSCVCQKSNSFENVIAVKKSIPTPCHQWANRSVRRSFGRCVNEWNPSFAAIHYSAF